MNEFEQSSIFFINIKNDICIFNISSVSSLSILLILLYFTWFTIGSYKQLSKPKIPQNTRSTSAIHQCVSHINSCGKLLTFCGIHDLQNRFGLAKDRFLSMLAKHLNSLNKLSYVTWTGPSQKYDVQRRTFFFEHCRNRVSGVIHK